MLKKFILLLLFAGTCGMVSAQWTPLPSGPFSTLRFDDVYFVNDQVGWTCNGQGEIYKTVDGGTNWFLQFSCPYYFRSIEFLNASVGFAGTLDSKVYKTNDGGSTWIDFTADLPVVPNGICGMSHFGNTIFMVGAYFNGAKMYKSFDGGNTWTYQGFNFAATNLVDCLFLNANEILVCGIAHPAFGVGGVIVKSNDGGATWTPLFQTALASEYVWKLFSTGTGVVYASVESTIGNSTWFVKSTDWGNTWTKKLVSSTVNIDAEGIGFLNDSVGFIDGYGIAMYTTIDGGDTWSPVQPHNKTNRFFMLPSGIGYASGVTVWKYTPTATAVPEMVPHVQEIHNVTVTPNPAFDKIEVKAKIGCNTYAIIEMTDEQGRPIAGFHDGKISAGAHLFTKDIQSLPKGIYYITMRTHEHFKTAKLLVSK